MGGDFHPSQMLTAYGVAKMKSIANFYAAGVDMSDFVFTAELKTRRKTYVVQRSFGWHREAIKRGRFVW